MSEESVYGYVLSLVLLAIIGFIQNAAFTFSSRSRNSGDPQHHRKAALLSNGIWFGCHILVWSQIWEAVTTGNYIRLVITGCVYVLSTTEGSVYMMRRMLRTETGKRRVGANGGAEGGKIGYPQVSK